MIQSARELRVVSRAQVMSRLQMLMLPRRVRGAGNGMMGVKWQPRAGDSNA